MRQRNVRRVPMPTEGEIHDLPDMAFNMLAMFKDMPIKDYKNLARSIVDISRNESPDFSAKIKYANPRISSLLGTIYSSTGEYNPDKIPISTYEKMALHPQIALGTALVENPILSQNWRIECEDEKQALIIQNAVEVFYRKTLRGMLRAYRYGFAAGQKVPTVKKMKIESIKEDGTKKTVYNDWVYTFKKIKFAHPASIKIIRDKKTEEIKYVTQDVSSYGKRVPKVAIEKMLWFALDDDYGNFFGESRYKAAYQPWYWASVVTQFMLRYLERRGSPSAVSKAPPGSTVGPDGSKVDNLVLALHAAESATSNSAVAIPSQFDRNTGKELWDVSLLEDKQRGELFTEALNYLNRQIMRALFVGDKVAVADGSSTNATAESHVDMHLMILESITQYVEEAFNTQIIPYLVMWNFPENERRPCKIKIERLNYSKKTMIKEVLLRMLILTGGSIRDGITPKYIPSLKKMLDFLEIPGDLFDNIFLPSETSADRDSNNDPPPDSNENDDMEEDEEDDDSNGKTDLEKEQSKQDQNAKAEPRRERTSRERKSQERR